MSRRDDERPNESAGPNTGSRTATLVMVGGAVLLAGLGVAWMDTRPGWDDTGITVGAVVLVAAGGALGGVRPWLSATLTVVPLLAAELPGGAGVLLAIPMAVLGAAAGSLVRRLAFGTGSR